ncbi:hypothetical protein HPB48_002778 [Haemaphysalis longicornis]|uniref:Uncharacterized protein n=1 Tax=Haemaphysalis longicornis TaxID=44386 RepID=A0A9J6GNF1_HAELO|nr:hypothetical protein HPB48_002778 [Haemaphysalis longicornis]
MVAASLHRQYADRDGSIRAAEQQSVDSEPSRSATEISTTQRRGNPTVRPVGTGYHVGEEVRVCSCICSCREAASGAANAAAFAKAATQRPPPGQSHGLFATDPLSRTRGATRVPPAERGHRKLAANRARSVIARGQVTAGGRENTKAARQSRVAHGEERSPSRKGQAERRDERASGEKRSKALRNDVWTTSERSSATAARVTGEEARKRRKMAKKEKQKDVRAEESKQHARAPE